MRLRWDGHRRLLLRNKHHSRYLQASWNKHGAAQFAFRLLLLCDKKNLIFYEQRALDALKPEYNVAPRAGNSLGLKHTEATRAKLSAARLGWKATPEQRAKMSITRRGKKHRAMSEWIKRNGNPFRGKKHGAEARAKMSAARRDTHMSEATKAKVAATLAAMWTPEQRTARAEWMKANNLYRGKRHSDEVRAKMRGRKRSAETCARISAATRGRRHTAETKAKISANSLAMWTPGRRAAAAARTRAASLAMWKERRGEILAARRAKKILQPQIPLM